MIRPLDLVLVYGAETIKLPSRVLNGLEITYSQAFMKIFTFI